jgi:predicted permease
MLPPAFHTRLRGTRLHYVWQDVKFGLRTLAKNPGFTATAVLTLALAIGANTAIFSILDPLLLRKLPVKQPDQLVLVHGAGSMESEDEMPCSAYEIFRANQDVFDGVIAYAPNEFGYDFQSSGITGSAQGQLVSANYFRVLGAEPFAGRDFSGSTGGQPDGQATATEIILGFDFWRREFHADAGILGRTISLAGDRAPYNVIGVAPPGFFGAEVGEVPDFYLPLPPRDQANAWVKIIGRLKAGVSISAAESAIAPLRPEVIRRSPLPEIEVHQDMERLVLTPAARGRSALREQFSLPALILMAVVAGILLIACVNVANLMIARGAARRKEITVRLALGAGRARIARQLLTETTLLALAGAAAGILLARWTSAALVAALSTRRLPAALPTGLNARVLAFTAVVLVATVLACGLVPALLASRSEISDELKSQSSPAGKRVSRGLWSKTLIAAQVALAVTILAGAGLLLHSLFNLETFDAGFDRDNVIVATLADSQHQRPAANVQSLYSRLHSAAEALPGVHAVALSGAPPVSGTEIGVNVALENQPPRAGESHAFFMAVSPGYFQTLGIPVFAGRDFSATDAGAPPMSMAIINRTMARHYFGDANPIGKRFRMVEGNRPPMEIVGVVADSTYNDLREQTPDFFYLDREQSFAPPPSVRGTIALSVAPNARHSTETALAGMVRSLDPNLSVTNVQTLRQEVDESLHQDRLIAGLCAVLSALALALTCVGLYGVLSFQVSRRTAEIGVRVVLGAAPRNILNLIVGQGMRLVIVGLLLGIGGAAAASTLLKSLLFRVGQVDAVTIAGVCIALALSAAAASYIPARRAAHVDPIEALRTE